MKKLLLVLFLSVCVMGFSAHASHIIGYDMNIINVKNSTTGAPTNTYIVRVKFFRDMSGIDIPASFTFAVLKNSDNSPALVLGNPLQITTPKINAAGTPLLYEEGDCAPPGFS